MIPDSLRRSLPYRALRKLKRAIAGDPPVVPSPRRGFVPSEGYASVSVATPEPPHNLLNALYNDSYHTLIDHCARGAGRHMTADGLVNNVIENDRIIYIRDDETGAYFTANWSPVARPPDHFEGIAKPGLQTICTDIDGLSICWDITVPEGADPVELWRLRIDNPARRPRRLSVFVHVSMKCDGVDLYCGDLFRIARYLPEQQAVHVRIDAVQHAALDFPWHNGFLTADREPEGWDCNPGAFIGPGGRTLRDPLAVARGHCSHSIMSMWAPVAALHYRFELAGQNTETIRFMAGACDTPEMIARLKQTHFASEARPAQPALHRRMEEAFALETPDLSIGGMLNQWVKLQTHYGLYWGRWGFCGYRDQLQHVVGNVSFAPELAKQRILAACKHQFADGFALRGWRPIDRHRNVDSGSWLIHAATEYIKESGDFAILDEPAVFFDGGQAPVLQHLIRVMDRLREDRGAHGLPLSFEGDWNDSLTGPCRAGRGESVWMAMAFCRAATLMEELADRIGDAALSARMRDWGAEMRAAINAHGWDGEWYLCALDDDGAPVGSAQNDEGKIFLVAQAWASLSGAADPERWEAAWRSVRKHLNSGWGYMLNWPAYTKPVANVGRLSHIRPGAGENGSVYTHGNAFLFWALLERGMADEALEVWRAINPANPARPGAAIPNVFYNGFYGPDSEIMAGLADHAWTTGSCVWMLHGAVELMLGLRRTYDGIVVRPCLPSSWPSAKITRKYRGTTYDVQIENPHGVAAAAVESITVDGAPYPVSAPLPIDGSRHCILVRLGAFTNPPGSASSGTMPEPGSR